MKVNILGTEYTIKYKTYEEDSCLKENSFAGYCTSIPKEIVILDLNKDERWSKEEQSVKDMSMKETLRHEIIHAFFNESGLQDSSNKLDGPWAKNEEMVDWIAIQFPKILKAFREANCI